MNGLQDELRNAVWSAGVVLGVMQHTPMFKPADEAARGIAWAATAPELADNSGALYMRGKQLSLKGAARDQ